MDTTDTESTNESVQDFTARILKKCCEKRVRMNEESKKNRAVLDEYSIQKFVSMKGRVERRMSSEEESEEEKENSRPTASVLSTTGRSTLKRLGNLYAEGDLSSPIHRTESRFCEESPEKVVSAQPEARTARLAALADQIRGWEDDLSRPTVVKKEPERRDRFGNVVGKKSARAPKALGEVLTGDSGKKDLTQKPGGWDRKVLATLEAQGFARCESNEHLVYDYKRRTSPAKCLSPSRNLPGPSKPFEKSPKKDLTPPEPPVKVPSPIKAPEKVTRLQRPVEQSPKKNTAVLEMAAQYESPPKPLKTPVKDPAEMTLAERKALFERNGGGAILPKAPLGMPVPAKVLIRSPPKAPQGVRTDFRVLSQRHEEERTCQSSAVKDEISRRRAELEGLKRRWVKQPEVKEVPAPPPMPVVPPPPPMPSPNRTLSPKYNYPVLNDVKRIKLSPPKPGRLYPSVSDIETETESEAQDFNRTVSSSDDESDGSLGREIVKVASTSKLRRHSTLKRVNWKDASSSSESRDESRVLQEIDDFLDEALGEPSPPKRSRDSSFEDKFHGRGMVSHPSGSCRSSSFEYSDATDEKDDGRTDEHKLVHTISVYRKQQGVKLTIKREDEIHDESTIDGTDEKLLEEEMVGKKIHDLLIEVSRQQTVIAQASQALNLCHSTLEFSGSVEQIEGEKLLLIASKRREGCLQELQRLRVEKTLRVGGGSREVETGDLTIESITVPVKMEAVRLAAREENCHYVVCLARCGERVLATEMLPAVAKNIREGRLNFVKPLAFKSLFGDFALTVEIYTLLARSKELLPHDVKYHITSKKDKRLTPKKGPKCETKLLGGVLESPGGPNTVRTSVFQMSGFVVFSLRDLNRSHYTLNKVPYKSVVEGSVGVVTRCEMSLETEHRGFLTMFEDISGFGAWHRRWCLLHGDKISYWKYPEDERAKIALDTVDLSQAVTREVSAVARDVCARPNTFLLEVERPSRPGDEETLVVKPSGAVTRIRYLLSADTREERTEWCRLLTKTLNLLKAWGKN